MTHTNFYENATRLAEIGVWSLNLQTNDLYWSDFHKKMWGYDLDPGLTLQDWSSPIIPEDFEKTIEILNKAIADKKKYAAEYRIINQKTKEKKWMRSFGELIFDNNGEAIHLTGVTIDITEEVQYKEQLEESKSMKNQILDDLHDGLMLFKAVRNEIKEIIDFEWTYVNKKASSIVGKSPGYLKGKHLLVEMPGNKDAGLFENYVKVVKEDSKFSHEFYYNYDGLDTYFQSVSIKVGDGFGVLFSDITHRVNFVNSLEAKVKERTQELINLNATLTDRNNQLQNFNFITAHHLQEPLRKMQLLIDLFQSTMHSESSEEASALVTKLNAQLYNMREKIIGIRKLTELDLLEDREFKQVEIGAVLQNLVARTPYSSSKITFDINYSKLNYIHSNSKIIDQLFTKLIDNVLNHATFEKPTIIRIYSEQIENNIIYYFEDNGVGFDPRLKNSAFDLFTTFNKNKSEDNIGIGLTIVKKIMALHQGEVSIDTDKAKGTRITLLFPLQK